MSDYIETIHKPQYISDELLKAIDMIASARDKELSFDKTIIAKIIKLNNADTGEYYVNYQEGTFKAYDQVPLKTVYKEDTEVYVKVPQGDFSNKKIIEGTVSALSLKEEEYDYLSTQMAEAGYGYLNSEVYSIPAGIEDERISINIPVTSPIKESSQFSSLFTSYPNIKIAADFKATNFQDIPIMGNFGLEIVFYYKNPDTGAYSECTRVIDKLNFTGSLGEYETFSPQYAYYSFNTNNMILTNIKSITFFAEGYEKKAIIKQDKALTSAWDNKDMELLKNIYNISYSNFYLSFEDFLNSINTKGIEETINENREDNIYVTNIKVAFMDAYSELDNLYYVGVKSPGGLVLNSDQDSLELEGIFYYEKKDILNTENCEYYWFSQNPAVTASHKNYNSKAGPGWEIMGNDVFGRILNNELTLQEALSLLDKTVDDYIDQGTRLREFYAIKSNYDEEMQKLNKSSADYSVKAAILTENYNQKKELYSDINFQRSVNSNKLIIKGLDVYQTLGIKFVVIYNNTNIFSKEVKIKKQSNNRFSIIKDISDNGSTLTLLDGQNVSATNTVADWYVHLSDGSYMLINKETDRIFIDQYLTDPEAKFQLSISIGNRSVPFDYTIKNYSSTNNVNVVFNVSGAENFLFDANGDIETTGLTYIFPKIQTKQGIFVESVKWTAPNGEDITTEGFLEIENSMITNLKLSDSRNYKISFDIRKSFESARTSNTLILTVKTTDGNEYYFNKIISFSKQGAQNSIGLTYSLAIKNCDKNGTEIADKFNPLIFNDRTNEWTNSIYLKPEIYSNGAIIKDKDSFTEVEVTAGGEELLIEYVYSIEYKFIGIQVNIEKLKNNNVIKVFKETNSINVNGQYFVRVKATITLTKNGTRIDSQNLIAYEPITILNAQDLDISKLTEVKIPKLVNYTSTAPVYEVTPLSLTYDGISYPLYDYSNQQPKSLTNFISIEKTSNNIFTIKPITSYTGAIFPLNSDFGDNNISSGMVPMGAIIMYIPKSRNMTLGYIIQPIVMILASYSNTNIEDYDGTAVCVVNPDDDETESNVSIDAGSGQINNNGLFCNGAFVGSIGENRGVYTVGEEESSIVTNALNSNGTFILGIDQIEMTRDNYGNNVFYFGNDFIQALQRELGLASS